MNFGFLSTVRLLLSPGNHCAWSCSDLVNSASSLAGAAISIIFVATNTFFVVVFFCRDKSMLAATKLLSRQNYVCSDEILFLEMTPVAASANHTAWPAVQPVTCHECVTHSASPDELSARFVGKLHTCETETFPLLSVKSLTLVVNNFKKSTRGREKLEG